jgi:hypothetical protein
VENLHGKIFYVVFFFFFFYISTQGIFGLGRVVHTRLNYHLRTYLVKITEFTIKQEKFNGIVGSNGQNKSFTNLLFELILLFVQRSQWFFFTDKFIVVNIDRNLLESPTGLVNHCGIHSIQNHFFSHTA